MITALYRIPFEVDPQWNIVGKPNWDDPNSDPDYRHGDYAFDFGFPEGHKILAARSGTVIDSASDRTGPTPAGGNFVFVRHHDSTIASYAHLKHNEVYVKKGDWVDQGRIIALSGNTGASSAAHLHFQVMIYGNHEGDYGVSIPILFEDKNHPAWRPKAGELVVPNNIVTRQENWRWCHKCQGLFFGGALSGSGSVGKCSAGGGHSPANSGNYILVENAALPGAQGNWRWCNKCQGLFFAGHTGSKCPAGGEHSKSGSGDYCAPFTSSNTPGQSDWRWCKKCEGMFFGGHPGSVCPGGGQHDKSGSGDYSLIQLLPPNAQGNWRYCRKCQGLYFGGLPFSVCPVGGQHDQNQSGYYTLMIDLAPFVKQKDWWVAGQNDWRMCKNCRGLFFGGHPGSKCPADNNGHNKEGSANYVLLMNSPTAPGQKEWRWCQKCQGLFFTGKPGVKSKCPADGLEHTKTGSGNYSLL
ncbi:MAG: M23 family metallopeptidase [Chitinophagaceae bacterium]